MADSYVAYTCHAYAWLKINVCTFTPGVQHTVVCDTPWLAVQNLTT